MGNVTSILSARISYFLNLKGPSVALDTACSSSLVAVHRLREPGLRHLRHGAGGRRRGDQYAAVHRCGDRGRHAVAQRPLRHLRCGGRRLRLRRGSGAVVLKRLADAIRDGDVIHGVIRGSGINQDGRTNGITAPSAPSQAALEVEVYRRAGIDPASISYVEAHGTGTPLGDPIEVEALTQSFRRSTDRRGFCALGSAKTNIGHALTAAGIAGLLKLLMMLRHRRIPPLVGFTAANPRIDFAATPFTLPTTARAGMGVAGTAPRRGQLFRLQRHQRPSRGRGSPGRAATRAGGGPILFLLSGRSEDARRSRAAQLAERPLRWHPICAMSRHAWRRTRALSASAGDRRG